MDLSNEVGVKVIWALSLPGKVAPITAGEIIADTILNIRETSLDRER
jgi:dipicolinate synthase subunit A